MTKYIAFDCETGGIEIENSLLTAYFVVLADDLTTILGELDLKIKPDNKQPYVVQAEALGINKIDLIKHDAEAITLSQASTLLYEFLKLHSGEGKSKLIPVGHNVVFDEEFIHAHMLKKTRWNQFVSYRRLDTGTVAEFFRLTGAIPKDVKGALGEIASYYGIAHANAHNAKADTLTTVKVLRKMKGVGKAKL